MLYLVVRKEVGMFIKILTKTYKGEKRYYASNLPKDQFPADCFGELYHPRHRTRTGGTSEK